MNTSLPLDSHDRSICRDLQETGVRYEEAERRVLAHKLQLGWLPQRLTVSDSVPPWEFTLS